MNHTMNHKIGAEVILTAAGMGRYPSQSRGTKGVIIQCNGYYTILWENGHENSYGDSDIAPVPKFVPGDVFYTRCTDGCLFRTTSFCPGPEAHKNRKAVKIERVDCLRSAKPITSVMTKLPDKGCPIGLCVFIKAGPRAVQLNLFPDPVESPKVEVPDKPRPAQYICHHCKNPIPTSHGAAQVRLRDGQLVYFYNQNTAESWLQQNDRDWIPHADFTRVPPLYVSTDEPLYPVRHA